MPNNKNSTSIAWNVLKILLALGLVLFVLSKLDLTNLVATLKNASVFWLVVSGVLYFMLTLLKALQYYVTMKGKLTYPQMLNVIIWQNAVSNYFLTGAGIATYITLSRMEHKVNISRSVTTFVLTKMGDLISIWFVLMIASKLVWSDIGVLHTPVILLLVGIGVGILVFFLTILFRQKFLSILSRILTWFKAANIKVVESGMSYLQSLATMEQNKVLNTFGLLLFYSVISLVVAICLTYANLAIFHLRPDVSAILFVSVLMQLVSYLPVSVFGGLGITETSALYFWSFFNLPQDVLVSALIGNRVVFYLFNLIPLIYLPLYSALKPKEQLRNEQ